MSSRKISQNSHRSATQLTAFTASLALDVFSLLSRLAMADQSTLEARHLLKEEWETTKNPLRQFRRMLSRLRGTQ
nr:hypothetical protein [uncultured Pseudomonas sp.]